MQKNAVLKAVTLETWKESFGILGLEHEDNIKMNSQKVGCGDVKSIELTQEIFMDTLMDLWDP
jgi:hypothetical protein